MSATTALGHETGAVTAGLQYTVDTGVKPVNETFGPNNIRRRVSGENEVRQMTIRDGRPLADEFDLEVTGFEFVEHKTRVRDFFDSEELKRVYYPEVEALVKKVSGASRVVVFDHTLRSGDEAEREAKLVREPVLNVHNDYTEWSGPQRVRDLLPGEAEALLQTIADARSLAPGDLIRAERRYPNRVGETYRIRYNPAHRWFYFPEMRRDEALVFKVFDSAKDGRARFTAHSSFVDPTTPEGAPPRQSIEARTLAFFS
ncbi:MAG: methyltransferase [Betaproteobacteria bacterium]|nr:MAG: methyltransferase [Betaproteobacteria bacterium]